MTILWLNVAIGMICGWLDGYAHACMTSCHHDNSYMITVVYRTVTCIAILWIMSFAFVYS